MYGPFLPRGGVPSLIGAPRPGAPPLRPDKNQSEYGKAHKAEPSPIPGKEQT
jgi:hypothetical protein